MTFDEYIGRTVQVLFVSVGVLVVGYALILGGRELLRRVRGDRRERQAQTDFEGKVGLS